MLLGKTKTVCGDIMEDGITGVPINGPGYRNIMVGVPGRAGALGIIGVTGRVGVFGIIGVPGIALIAGGAKW